MNQNGVIETATGDLLRAGFCDFQNDGSFDSSKESYRTDVPFPAQPRSGVEWHRWDGNAWIMVSDLMVTKKERLYELRTLVTEYIGSHYDSGAQNTLNALWIEGISKGWTNRKAKVQSVMDWVNTVLAYFYAQKDAILSAGNPEQLETISSDFSQFDAVDPLVTVQSVMAAQD